ncbi:hypothetical protein BJ875DRAFT_538452 [Amylocarpus encephaloides]|uniref:Uncharacterized protein n=1 Tax=Amylocarpus encephaloides TaxID=45428 RepID=A0A9P7YTJ0_9HELO|nr:hypothetical protein BJ875DRAFT_538452 [Amylocarpus encephaloides]
MTFATPQGPSCVSLPGLSQVSLSPFDTTETQSMTPDPVGAPGFSSVASALPISSRGTGRQAVERRLPFHHSIPASKLILALESSSGTPSLVRQGSRTQRWQGDDKGVTGVGGRARALETALHAQKPAPVLERRRWTVPVLSEPRRAPADAPQNADADRAIRGTSIPRLARGPPRVGRGSCDSARRGGQMPASRAIGWIDGLATMVDPVRFSLLTNHDLALALARPLVLA